MFPRYQARLALLLLVLTTVLSVAGPAEAEGPSLPPGFSDTLVARISFPTSIAFVPDGRVLVLGHSGAMRVIKDGKVLPIDALGFKDRICANSERGLLGITVDPDFATNKFIYLFYTAATSTTLDLQGKEVPYCPYNEATNPQNPVNRLSRFVLGDNNKVDLASETVLLDNIFSLHGNHNGGDLHFGKDGMLYVSVGDAGCDWKFRDPSDPTRGGCADSNGNAREPFLLSGKILRIKPDGSVPPDNPWAKDPNAVPCALTGRTEPGKKCAETYVWGLRNPFRIALDPHSSVPQRLYINDVGQRSWEEINQAVPGQNYGWNHREGFCKREQFSIRDCRSTPGATVDGLTDPIFAYRHPAITSTDEISGISITGGAFIPAGVWATQYDGDFLFADFGGWMATLEPNPAGGYSVNKFGDGLGPVVTLKFGDYLGTPALYYTTYANKGELRVITFDPQGANRTPNARLALAPSAGPAPLTVSFDGSQSSDLDGDALAYLWDFGDGQIAETQVPTVTHTYAANGIYTATLRVRDSQGALSPPEEAQIAVGDLPLQPQILSPSIDLRYHVGQEIVLEGSASDPEEGLLPGERLTWNVLLHHDEHIHPWVQAVSGSRVTFRTPPPEDLLAPTNSWLEIQLQASDSRGLSSVITQELRPQLVNVTLNSLPSGATVEVNAVNVTTPYTFVSWPGWELRLSVPDQTGSQGRALTFAGWADANREPLRSVVTPGSDATYTAYLYEPGASPQPTMMRLVLFLRN